MARSAVMLGRQRNLFAVLSGIFLGIIVMLSFALMRQDKETILVPVGLKEKAQISSSGFSDSYLEQMSAMFLSNLLDLNPSNIAYKKKLVLGFVTPESWQNISNYFDEMQAKYKSSGLRTTFTVKEFEINGLSVTCTGLLQAYYGKKGYQDKKVRYRVSFDARGNLSEFVKIEEPCLK